jgi:hypothetical protein
MQVISRNPELHEFHHAKSIVAKCLAMTRRSLMGNFSRHPETSPVVNLSPWHQLSPGLSCQSGRGHELQLGYLA